MTPGFDPTKSISENMAALGNLIREMNTAKGTDTFVELSIMTVGAGLAHILEEVLAEIKALRTELREGRR